MVWGKGDKWASAVGRVKITQGALKREEMVVACSLPLQAAQQSGTTQVTI